MYSSWISDIDVYKRQVMGVATYGLALLLSGGLNRDDLNLIPKLGEPLIKLAEKYNLLRQ